jgi:hypothetical protein
MTDEYLLSDAALVEAYREGKISVEDTIMLLGGLPLDENFVEPGPPTWDEFLAFARERTGLPLYDSDAIGDLVTERAAA